MKIASGISSIFTICLIFILSTTCKKDDTPATFFETVSYKYINQLIVSDDKLWVLSSTPQRWIDIVAILPPYQISVYDLETDEFLINEKIPSISTMTLDNSQKPFLATFDRRILKLNDDLSWEEYFKLPAAGLIQTIVCSQDNYIAIPTYTAGLYLFNGSDTLIYNSLTAPMRSNGIASLAVNSESNILFMQANELYRIDRNKVITRDPDSLPVDNPAGAFFLSSDKDNTIWVSKWDGNRERIYKKSVNTPWTEVGPPESSAGRPIRFIRSDSRGTIWIAYSDYPKDLLAYYDSGQWNIVQTPLEKIIILDVDTYKDEIIIGTSEGIYRTVMK
jgi:hypothetical protein